MGLLDIFSSSQMSDKKIDKAAKLASNPFAQPDVRMREMERLVEDATDASLAGVLRRFAANAQGHIADEEEKKWLEDALVELGEKAVRPLEDFISREQQPTYALRAYRRIRGVEAAHAFFLKVLLTYGPDEYRAIESKLQLVLQLAEDLSEVDTPATLLELGGFLRDHSDDVRWVVADVIEQAAKANRLQGEALDRVRGELSLLATDPDCGPRVQKRAAELLCSQEWILPGDAQDVAPLLRDDYFLDKKRIIRRRVKKA